MRWTRWTAWASGLATLTAVIAIASCANRGAGGAMTPEQKLARGRTIAWTSGCMDCHTPGSFYGAPDTTRLLAGSELGWKGPWGVSYPRNLTPDNETGIGSWTEDQIVTAVREGHRPDGTPLLPPMPWPSYAHLSDDDAHALATYLKSIPAVPHKVPAVVPPGSEPSGQVIVIPPPPAWDAKNLPPAPAPGAPGNNKM